MPRRRGKFIPPPSHLSRILDHLNTGPRLALPGLRRLSLTLAAKNDHMGARHFIKDDLPRIRWANPLLDIAVTKIKSPSPSSTPSPRAFPAQAVLEFQDGRTSTIDMSNKWSTTIAKELMDLAGGDPWMAYKSAALAAGHPVLPGEDKERLAQVASVSRKTNASEVPSPEARVQDTLLAPSRPKTGAAAILP